MGCAFTGVLLLAGLPWALITFASLLLLDLLSDLLTRKDN